MDEIFAEGGLMKINESMINRIKELYFKGYGRVKISKIMRIPEYTIRKILKPNFKEYQINYYQKNKDAKRILQKEYLENPLVKMNHIKLEADRYQREKEHIYQKNKERRKIDTQFRIKTRLMTALNGALRKYTKTGKIMSSKKYGIDYGAIIKHLGEPPDYENNYDIDHIKPLSKFDLNDPEQVKQAFAPENLRWLKHKWNIKKGNRYKEKIKT